VPGLIVKRRRGEAVVIVLNGFQTEPPRQSYNELEGGEMVVAQEWQATIRIVEISRTRVALNVQAPNDVRVLREELPGVNGHGVPWFPRRQRS